MNSGIDSQITALIASALRVDEAMVRRDTTFAGDLAADSLDLVALILAIEDEFQIDIHDEEAAEILTVGQLIEYVAFALAVKTPTVAAAANSGGTISLR
jgi:acyl carrier protein